MDGAPGMDNMQPVWDALYDAIHPQEQQDRPLQRHRASSLSSDSGTNEYGPSNNEFDEMNGLEYPHAPPSTPAGSETAVCEDDVVSDGDSDIRYGLYSSSVLRFTPPNGREDTPTGAQFGVNSVQDWWDRPHVLVFDEFEIKMVHSAILHIIEKEEEQRKAPEIAKEEAQKKASQLKNEIRKAKLRKALVDIGFMSEKELEKEERRARVKMEKEREEEKAKERAKRNNKLKLDAAQKTVENLIFAAADKKTSKDAFIEGKRVGRLLFWRAIEGQDEYVDTLLRVYSLILGWLVPRLCQTALKQDNPLVSLSFVGGIERAYRKLAKKIPQDPPTADSHPEGRRVI